MECFVENSLWFNIIKMESLDILTAKNPPAVLKNKDNWGWILFNEKILSTKTKSVLNCFIRNMKPSKHEILESSLAFLEKHLDKSETVGYSKENTNRQMRWLGKVACLLRERELPVGARHGGVHVKYHP